MKYGIFYSQCEISKKNGRLASIDDAIRIAKECMMCCPIDIGDIMRSYSHKF